MATAATVIKATGKEEKAKVTCSFDGVFEITDFIFAFLSLVPHVRVCSIGNRDYSI